jgi:hypothetical protein
VATEAADHTIASDGVHHFFRAGVVELADTPALGAGGFEPWGFESLRPHRDLDGMLDGLRYGAPPADGIAAALFDRRDVLR